MKFNRTMDVLTVATIILLGLFFIYVLGIIFVQFP